MDDVQKFIANNQHQLGYIMNEASRQWIQNDPIGAFTVGECNVVVEKNGQYHELLDKAERYEKVLTEISRYPKVRGIGTFLNKYNSLIELAETTLRRK